MSTQTAPGIDAIMAAAEKQPWMARAHSFSTNPWASMVLPLASLRPLRIDEDENGYQRPISQSRVDDLVDKFDAGEAREIYISRRPDGSMYILDGQHTHALLMKMGFTEWPCRVFYNLTLAEEARRFAEYQSNTRRIPPVVQFNAEVIAKDPSAVALDRILSEFYLRISSSKLRTRDGYLGVTSRAVFEKIYNLGGETLLREVLQLAIDVWNHRKDSFMGRILQGMGYLFAYSEGEFDRDRMVAVLKEITPKQLVEHIGPTGSGGASRAGALAILSLYLEGTRTYPRIRSNAKEAPHLPENLPKDGPQMHEIWSEGTADLGRTTVRPHVDQVKATKEEIAANEAAALMEETMISSTLTEATEVVTQEAEQPVQAEQIEQIEDDDWSYPAEG